MQSDKRMVIALGGKRARKRTPEEQLTLIGAAAEAIVDLMDGGYNVTVTHGNGPQVGMIKVATDVSADKGGGTPLIPFAECGAMSQGYIGYHLQQAIGRELKKRGSDKQCVSVVTQTVVDVQDPAFQNPTKPVGAFFSEERAKELMAETGNTYVEDAGRGWRWVVPSPLPSAIVEAATVKTLIDAGASSSPPAAAESQSSKTATGTRGSLRSSTRTARPLSWLPTSARNCSSSSRRSTGSA